MKIIRITFLFLACSVSLPAQTLNPATMPRVTTVSPRFQSYNVEMVEVTGGRFWKPYSAEVDALLQAPKPTGGPVGMDPALYMYRKPIDLTNPRLRKLAAALGPAYIRVSGTWQNSTFFQNSEAFLHSQNRPTVARRFHKIVCEAVEYRASGLED